MKRPVQHLLALERLHQVLTASTIAESIESVSVASKAQEALEIMNQRHFDVLGLAEGGNVIGYLPKNDLDSQDNIAEIACSFFKKDFKAADLVSESCPLKDCVSKLGQTERLFVLRSTGVDAIITRADLHKQPVRMLLFSVVSLLEMALLSLIQKAYRNEDEWKKLLCSTRIHAAKELLKKRQDCGIEIDLADCLQLVDKGTIAKKTEYIRVPLGLSSKTQCDNFFGDLEKIRNPLAHGQAFETVPGLSWQQILDTFHKAQEVLENTIRLLANMEVKGLEDAESPS
jgi:predicted transcriptional regulator